MSKAAMIIVAFAMIHGIRFIQASEQKEMCALEVLVLSEDLKPTSSAEVDLISSDGEVVQTEKTDNGIAKFCDFGFGNHSIKVRQMNPPRPFCQSKVDNIKYLTNIPQRIIIVMNTCLGYGADGIRGSTGGGGITTCTAFLRITTPDRLKISDVRIKSNQRPSQSFSTDKYGKSFIPVDVMTPAEITISKAGFKTEKRQIQCSNPYATEEISVTLMPLK